MSRLPSLQLKESRFGAEGAALQLAGAEPRTDGIADGATPLERSFRRLNGSDLGDAGAASLALGRAHPCHICAGTGAQRCDVCAGTGPMIPIAQEYVPVSSREYSQYGTGYVRHESGGAPMLPVIYVLHVMLRRVLHVVCSWYMLYGCCMQLYAACCVSYALVSAGTPR